MSEPDSKVSLPYMPLFVRDFVTATQGWTLEERGAYLMLLFAQWEQGPLPDDRLPAIVGTSSTAFKAIWRTVGPKFKRTSGGLVNERLEGHRAKSLALIEGRRLGASITNAKRRGSGTVIPFSQGGGRE